MAKRKIDGIIEAVHFTPSKQVEWVRAYERRGPTFSDLVIIQRNDLIERIKSGKNFFVGSRKEYLASTFDVKYPLSVVQAGGKDCLAFSEKVESSDAIAGLPVI
jgi:hypothetical protein